MIKMKKAKKYKKQSPAFFSDKVTPERKFIPHREGPSPSRAPHPLPIYNQVNNKALMARRKPTKCIQCGNETYQDDGICILCKNNITGIYEELIESLTKGKKRKPRKRKIRVWGKR